MCLSDSWQPQLKFSTIRVIRAIRGRPAAEAIGVHSCEFVVEEGRLLPHEVLEVPAYIRNNHELTHEYSKELPG